jgi:hypothetical protein
VVATNRHPSQPQANNKTKPIDMIKQTKFIAAAILATGILSLSQNAFGGPSATQTVTYEVQAINDLSVSAATASVIISTATAGSTLASATDSSTTYAITTNLIAGKITGSIPANMPAGVTLSAQLEAPAGATSGGKLALSTTAADLVAGLQPVAVSGKTITYTLDATLAAGAIPSGTRVVTLTIVGGA